jgi:hypothetical protein
MRHSHNFDIPDNTTHIYLLPAQTVPEAVAASILGMGFKALSGLILIFILVALLTGFYFGCINLAGLEKIFKNATDALSFDLPKNMEILGAYLFVLPPVLFIGILFCPLCCDFVHFHFKNKESREGMRDEFIQRLKRNSLLIGIVFIFAIAMTPLAQYAEGTTALSMSASLAGFCLAALIANLFFVAFDTFANQLIWHAGMVFYRRYF